MFTILVIVHHSAGVAHFLCGPLGTGWFLTGFTGLRDDGRNAEGGEITRRARRGKGNSDCWQGYANAPPIILASVTFGDLKLGRHNHQTELT